MKPSNPSAREYLIVNHEIKAVLYPETNRIAIKDTIKIPAGYKQELIFSIHKGMNPRITESNVKLALLKSGGRKAVYESYAVNLPRGASEFTLEYSGVIKHPLEQVGKEYARDFRNTPGIISGEGVYLAGSSHWYPVIDKSLVSFTLEIELPEKWNAVSQGSLEEMRSGKGRAFVKWVSREPQDEIYLIAGRFIKYERTSGRVRIMAFFREGDEKLAGKFINTAADYIALYDALIGPYPYGKFALVENFWETGYGMPSFTLLGPKIIRFPFILHTSYPHEILHNWWGNSVFPDYSSGNWSEGLTAYLSDHLTGEQRGKGGDYRMTVLQKYSDYVTKGRDFPLNRFLSRHGSPSEAVGYGKASMFFHMLRIRIGDEAFIKGIREFYGEYKFKYAAFDDLRKSFEKGSGKKLSPLFIQWIDGTGAPKIRIKGPEVKKVSKGFELTAVIEQFQKGEPYDMDVPIAVTLEGEDKAHEAVVRLRDKKLELKLNLPSRPLRVDVDPQFDLFRRLDRRELPAALSQVFGSGSILILLPSGGDEKKLAAYRVLAEAIKGSGPDETEVRMDSEFKLLPAGRAVVLLGWENRFIESVEKPLSKHEIKIHGEKIFLENRAFARGDLSLALAVPNPSEKSFPLMLAASDNVKAIPGLGRKLPHYHRYSYLIFQGDEPENIARGRWEAADSPMTLFIPEDDKRIVKVPMARLAKREPLAAFPEVFSRERMMETARYLSGDSLEGRGLGSRGLDNAARYIAEKFREAGLKPGGMEDTYFQTWKERGGDPESEMELKNVVGILHGKDPKMKGESLVVGAHFDHLGRGWPDSGEKKFKGTVHPGADDNASGVAVMIELAMALGKSPKPDRTIIFAAFTGEESGKRGSRYYIKNQKNFPPGKCIGMVNLDTVGRLGGRKLLVLGGESAREWVHIFRGAAYVTGMEIDMAGERLDSSDQTSFHEAGVPAVQIFSGPHADYHRPADRIDRIDPDSLAKTASVAREAIDYLAVRKEPLTSGLNRGADNKRDSSLHGSSGEEGKRKVSLGTIPDFAFHGTGYRISGVVKGSPAGEAGMREGDVIIRIGPYPVKGMRDFSDILKKLKPGYPVEIFFMRGEKEGSVKVKLADR